MAQKNMFCYQCEQTAKGEGCTVGGVCGKSPDVAALQDLLVYALRGLALYALEGIKKGVKIPGQDVFTAEALFATLTNVNFDQDRFPAYIKKAVELRSQLKAKTGAELKDAAATFTPAADLNGLIEQGAAVGLKSDPSVPADLLSLQHIVLFGIKGVAAYAFHAQVFGQEDEKVYNFLYEALAAPFNTSLGANEWVGLALKTGEINLRTMELLDAGNTGAFGHPVPTKVPLGVKKGKAILVSGHELKDLEELLKQTEGKGITVYSHGEMLPCPRLSGIEEIQPFLRPLWHGMAEPAEGVHGIPGRYSHDHQLHPAACRELQGQYFYDQHGRLAGCGAYHGA